MPVFGNVGGSETPVIINTGGGSSTMDDAPSFNWDDFAGTIIGVIPGVIDSVNGNTPDTIIYQTNPATDNELDFGYIAIGIGVFILLLIILYVTLKK